MSYAFPFDLNELAEEDTEELENHHHKRRAKLSCDSRMQVVMWLLNNQTEVKLKHGAVQEVVNKWGNVLHDEFVHPVDYVVDFRTQINGIRPSDLKKVYLARSQMMFYEFMPNGDDWAAKARAMTNATRRKTYGTPITGRSSF
ncbi:hypothetical protein AgCh_003709 [Apium graveolens]